MKGKKDGYSPIEQISNLKPDFSSIPIVLRIVSENPDPKTIQKVIFFLSKLDPSDLQAVSSIVHFAFHKEKLVQKQTRIFLKKNPRWMEGLRKLLRSKAPNHDHFKIKVSLLLAEEGDSEISIFLELLVREKEIDRRAAKKAFVKIGAKSVPKLLALLRKYTSVALRKDLLEIFSTIGPASVSRLTTEIRNSKGSILELIEDSLIGIGKEGIPAQLRVFRIDQSQKLKKSLVYVFARIGTDSLPNILPLANDPSPAVQALAQDSMKKLGKEAVLFLRSTLQKSKNTDKKNLALLSLAQIGPNAKSAIKEIKPFLTQKGPLQYSALRAVHKMGKIAEKVVPELTKAFNSFRTDDTELLREAAYALSNAGPKAKPALKSLIRRLDNEEVMGSATIAICKAIGSIGVSAKSAIPSFKKRLNESEEGYVLRAIVEALGNIGSTCAKDGKLLKKVLWVLGLGHKKDRLQPLLCRKWG